MLTLLSTTAACSPDSFLPLAGGCENNDDCVTGQCNNGTCGEPAASSSSSSSSSTSSSSSSSGTFSSSFAMSQASSSVTGGSSAMGGSSSSGGNPSSVMGSSSGTVSGPQVFIHVRATAATFNHTDGLSGQTPREHVYGIRGLKLLRTMGDPAPVLIFDHGTNYVEAPLSDGADTVVGQISAAVLPNETFTYGRVVLSHIGYNVDATMHASGNNLPGEFRNLHILGNNVTINTTTWQRGDYRYLFHSIAGDFPQQGSNGPLPTVPAAGGVTLVAEGDEVVLYLPANIPTSPDVTADVNVSFTLNTHQSFRWQDQATAPNTAGTFDATPTGTEPVMHFGANSYVVTVE